MSTTETTSEPAIRQVISLTNEAATKVAELIAAQSGDEELGLRIAVSTSTVPPAAAGAADPSRDG